MYYNTVNVLQQGGSCMMYNSLTRKAEGMIYNHAMGHRVTSNLTDISNYSDGVMNYFLTSNLIVHVNTLEYFLF